VERNLLLVPRLAVVNLLRDGAPPAGHRHGLTEKCAPGTDLHATWRRLETADVTFRNRTMTSLDSLLRLVT